MAKKPNSKRSLRLLPQEYPFLTWAVLFVLCFVLAVVTEGLATQFTFDKTTIPFLAIETLLPFIVVELLFVFFQGVATENEITEKSKAISDIALHNHNFFDTANQVFRIFHYHGKPAHDALRLAVQALFRDFRVQEDLLSFEDEFLSRVMYENFWQTLVDTQKAHREDGNLPDLVAFSTHSVSVRLWSTDQFKHLLDLQKQFVDAGGSLYRVLIKSANSPDKIEKYAEVAQEMADIGVNVFFVARDEPGKLYHDYFLASINGVKYADVWRTDLDPHGYHGNIFGSTVEIGNDRVNQYISKWATVVSWLRDKIKNPPSGDVPEILKKTPTPEMFAIMNGGPRG